MIIVYVSYLPPRRRFTAHRDGPGEIYASSLSELRERVATVSGEAKIRFRLSRGARAEMLRRRTGAHAEIGWTQTLWRGSSGRGPVSL